MADKDASMNYQFTKAGHDLAIQALAGDTQLDFTKAVTSTDNHFADTEADTSGLTELANIQQTIELTEVDAVDDDPSFVKVPVMIDKSTITADYAMLTIGLYCKPKDGDEVLYGVCALQDPIYMHKSSNKSTYTIDLNTLVGSASSVTIKVDPTGMVTNSALTATLKNYALKTDLSGLQPKGDYAKTVDVNQQLDKKVNIADMRKPASDVAGIEEVNTKVTDNKDGTEQLNGVKVQPYNKLSDVTNLRNIVLQTDSVTPYTAKGTIGESIQDFSLYSGFSSLPSGTQVYYSYDLVVTNADGGIHWMGWDNPWSTFVNNQHLTTDGIHHIQGTTTISDANIASSKFIHSTIDGSHATYKITNLMIVVGSIPVTHLPAPEDKQDKIGYTPADDSKVAHLSGTNNFDTVPTVNNNPLLLASSLPSYLANYIGINSNTSQVTNHTVKFNDGQLFVNTQPVLTYAGTADPDEATAKTKSSDGLLHYTIES